MPSPVEVTLLTRSSCHLCEVARDVIGRVLDEHPEATLTELSVDDDGALRARWSDDVPVVLINGRPHSRWRVDAARFAARLDEEASRESEPAARVDDGQAANRQSAAGIADRAAARRADEDANDGAPE